jgi:SOS response regulatory protein OraA/RecX
MAEKDYLATRLFSDRPSAEREYDALVARGYSANDINVIMTDEARKRHFGTGATSELGN